MALLHFALLHILKVRRTPYARLAFITVNNLAASMHILQKHLNDCISLSNDKSNLSHFYSVHIYVATYDSFFSIQYQDSKEHFN